MRLTDETVSAMEFTAAMAAVTAPAMEELRLLDEEARKYYERNPSIATEQNQVKTPPCSGSSVQDIPPLQTNGSSVENPDVNAVNLESAYFAYKNGIISEEEFHTLRKPIRAEYGFPDVAEGPLKDSGARRTFDTGAVRDISEGKGRCDLLPLDAIGLVIADGLNVLESPYILAQIEKFKRTKEVVYLSNALTAFAALAYNSDIYEMFLEVSKHYEDGAKKYSENNWMKGLPLHSFIDSGLRHFLKYLRGDTDEPHDRAFVWNMVGAIWTIGNKPELDDIMKDILKEEEK